MESKVSSCYVGGSYNLPTGQIVNQKIVKTRCISPKNQVCVSVKGNYMNDTIDAYFCSDSCSPGKDNGFQTQCCNVSDCNAPPKLSCIKSKGIDGFTPAPVECEYGETCSVNSYLFD